MSEIEIKRLEHLRAFIEGHPCKIERMGEEYVRAEDVTGMIDKTIAAVRKEQVHRNKN